MVTEQISDCLGAMRKELTVKGLGGIFGGWWKCSISWLLWWLHSYRDLSKIFELSIWVHFMVHKLYLNKDDFKNSLHNKAAQQENSSSIYWIAGKDNWEIYFHGEQNIVKYNLSLVLHFYFINNIIKIV